MKKKVKKTHKAIKKQKRKMTKKEIEQKKKKIKKNFFTIMSIIIILFIGLIINDYIILDKNKTINLVVNNNNVTEKLENEIIIDNNNIYISKDDIKTLFDRNIYKDDESNQIITTYDKKIGIIGFEQNEIIINGSKKETYAHAINVNNIEYLPISELSTVYNIEIQNNEETKVLTIDSLDKEQKVAIVSSNLPVKYSTNLISKTIDRVKKGDTVIIISSNEGNTKIRTQKGKIGYIKSNKLENEYATRENMIDEKQIEGEITLAIDEYSAHNKVPDRSGEELPSINVISPSFFYLDNNENLKKQKYIEWAHNKGYKVWPLFSNTEIVEVNNFQKRQELIEKLVTECVKYNLDGININFKNIKQEDAEKYSRFIIELTPRLKEIGLITTVNILDEPYLDKAIIGNIADYIILKSSDETIKKGIDESKIIYNTIELQ